METPKFRSVSKVKPMQGGGGEAKLFHGEYDNGEISCEVVIKLLPRYSIDEQQLNHIIQRCRKIADISISNQISRAGDSGDGCDNLVEMLDSGLELSSGCPYFVMKFMSGGSLADRQSEGVLASIGYVKAALEGLSRLHSLDILHLDVKPGNILIDDSGVVKLSDFGISHYKRGGQSASPFVTKEFASPEAMSSAIAAANRVAETDEPTLDERSDIYSMAATLYSLTTGGDAVSDPYLDRIGWPPLADVLKKALNERPNYRHQTAQELLADLDEVERQLRVDTTPLFTWGHEIWSAQAMPIGSKKPFGKYYILRVGEGRGRFELPIKSGVQLLLCSESVIDGLSFRFQCNAFWKKVPDPIVAPVPFDGLNASGYELLERPARPSCTHELWTLQGPQKFGEEHEYLEFDADEFSAMSLYRYDTPETGLYSLVYQV